MKNLNTGMMILGLILTGCNAPSSSPETATSTQGVTTTSPTEPTNDSPTHFAYLVEASQVSAFGIDPTTNQLEEIESGGMISNYFLCSIKIHPLHSNLMYATQCGNQAQENATGGIMEFSLNSTTGKVTLLGTYLEGGNQTNNVSPKDLGFDSSGNLYVRWLTAPVGFMPNQTQNEWLEKYTVNASTGLVTLQSTVTTSQVTTANTVNTYATAHGINLNNNESQTLGDFDYVINSSGNVDLYENGSLTSYTFTGEGSYLSLAIK